MAASPARDVLPSPATEAVPAARRAALTVDLAHLLAALVAAACWVASVRSGAHLLHFDAKAHLVVARRTMDSLTPGWTQLGAVWLPLPHMLNALPAQVDVLYATGLAGSLLSFAFFLLGTSALAAAARRATGDAWAGVVALAVPALNPGWLYLQSTPLIEALFLGLVAAMLASLVRWRETPRTSTLVAAAASAALACWVRYEAWPLATLAMAWAVSVERSDARRRTALVGLGAGVVGPILLYGLHSWISTGIPFYAIGEGNLTERRGDVVHAVQLLATGLDEAFGLPLMVVSVGAFVWLAARSRRGATGPLPPLALAALAPLSVTFTAYVAGHPTKARYALLAAPALALALAAATAGRRWLQAGVLVLAALQIAAVPRPLPVLREATRDQRDVAERLPVLAAFREQYTGGHVLASMGSLAPVLYELGQLGLPLREVVHEGNGNWWAYAVVDPGREVRWIISAQGDILDQERQWRSRSGYPEGFVPALHFGRVTIYRRAAASRMTAVTAPPTADR
jgi:hypothetical protein